MDMLTCFVSLFRLDDTLPLFQIPNGNNFFFILMCAIFFFIAGSRRKNKRNPVFQFVARAEKMLLLCLFGPHFVPRKKILHFYTYIQTQPTFFPIQFFSRSSFTTFSWSNGVVKHNITLHKLFFKSPSKWLPEISWKSGLSNELANFNAFEKSHQTY